MGRINSKKSCSAAHQQFHRLGDGGPLQRWRPPHRRLHTIPVPQQPLLLLVLVLMLLVVLLPHPGCHIAGMVATAFAADAWLHRHCLALHVLLPLLLLL